MEKLFAIVIAIVGFLCAVAFVVLDSILSFMSFPLCCVIAVSVTLVLAMLCVVVSVLTRLHGDLSRMLHGRNNKEK